MMRNKLLIENPVSGLQRCATTSGLRTPSFDLKTYTAEPELAIKISTSDFS
jgi:hypothetical protein